MRTATRTLPVLTLAAALAVAAPGTAHAKTKIDLTLRGYASPVAPVDGTVSFGGSTTGDPFHGEAFTGTYGAADGSLPVTRECEPATGTMTIGGDTAGRVTFALAGEICEHWGSYRSNGTWTVTDGTGEYAKAKGTGMFAFSAQLWGTIWTASGELKA